MRTFQRFPCFLSVRVLAATLCVAGLFGVVQAETASWPQFRGPGGLGSAPDSSIPDQFGPERNVRWQQQVPPGHSSPVIWDDRLFLTGFQDSTLLVLCYRRSDGSLLWEKGFPMSGKEEFFHRDGSPAAPTPVTDGERVHAYFGAYGLITLNMKGKLLWTHEFPFEASTFGTGSSPVLHEGVLYLVRDVKGLSTVHAFDAKTGEELWTTPRPEAGENYSTPFLWKHDGGAELIVTGSSLVKSYNLADGKPRWWVDGVTAIACPTPTASSDTLYFAGWSTPNVPSSRRLATGFGEDSGLTDDALADVESFVAHLDRNEDGVLQRDEVPGGRAKDAFRFLDFNRNGVWEPAEVQGLLDSPAAPGENLLVAIRGGGSGDVTETHVRWSRTKGLPYVASPLLHDGRLYYVKKGGYVSSVDAVTGNALYEAERLGEGGEYYSSPVGVGNRVLIGSVKGTLFVLGTGDELEILARNAFDEGIYATPAVIGDTLYVRTESRLYAIGSSGGAPVSSE